MPGYLDQYGAGEEQRNRIIIRSILAVVIVAVVGSLGWYLFHNHHQESLVRDFLAAVRRGDLRAAYAVWGCSDAKPCKGYDFDKFSSDWGASAKPEDKPDLSVLRIEDAESCNNGVLLTVDVNPQRTEALWVDKSGDAINFAPYPICPHKNPWAIMLHRTLGKLRKPLLN